MEYKILIIKNRYKEQLNISRYLAWFELNTPLKIITEIIETDFDLTTLHTSNAMFSGVIVASNILPKIQAIVPEGKYNAVVFIYGNELNGIRVSSCNILGTDPLYPDTEFIQTWQGQDGGKTINHELFHAFFYKAHKMQINIEDPMDTYLRDGELTVDKNINTNREIALERLAPYWHKICAFRTVPIIVENTNVVINRITDDGIQTLGNLIYDNFRCKTLERPWKNNRFNISCIPKGTYKCKYTFSPKFLKYTYELQNTSPRSGIRIHSGNYFFDINGCILMGDAYSDINKDGKVDVINSRKTIAEFEQLIGKKDFILEIR